MEVLQVPESDGDRGIHAVPIFLTFEEEGLDNVFSCFE